MADHAFTPAERRAVYRAIAQRRDMRRFVRGAVIPDEVLARLLAAAHAGPSVGLMQPWRFIRITDEGLRRRIHGLVDGERRRTARALGRRGREFLALKVEGILDCAELLVVALGDGRQAHVFGRRTMPQMDLASVSCAIQNLWLSARSEGLGMGWVSMFEPKLLAGLLGMPPEAEPVAILCLGPVPDFPDRPQLELDNWAFSRPLEEFVSENGWTGVRQPVIGAGRWPTMETMEQVEQQSFYDAVGGHATFHAIVSRFYALVREDEILRPVYPEDELDAAEERLRMFLEQYWGGPRTYSDRRGHPRLRMRHSPFRIGPFERDAWLRCMRTAVAEIDSDTLDDDHRKELLAYLEMAAHSMVNSPF